MGEFELLAKLRERLPPNDPRVRLGSGDDAAITVPGGATATSVDSLIEGVHFRRELSSPAQIGHKALAAALSDLAAMGAETGEAYIALGVPPDLKEDDCLELLDAAATLARQTGTTLAGGDISRAAVLTVTVTVVGHAGGPERFVTRSGAEPGNAVAVTGELGGAAAGLLALEHPQTVEALEDRVAASLCSRQLEPGARLEAGLALARGGATAMIDLSDGLAGDARHLARASATNLRIDAALLPIASGVAEIAAGTGQSALDLALHGGEDYELLVTLPRQRLQPAMAALRKSGLALTAIGEVAAGEGSVEIRLPGGGLAASVGFDQLA